ncbi:MAG: hypothetical protein QM783_17705 [Phycisphaerales bacterium]
MNLFTMSVLSASAALCGTAMAGFDTINCYFNGVGPGEGVSVSLNGNGISTTAGAFNWTRDGSNPGTLAGYTGNFQTFCIDLTQYISNGGPYAYSTFPAWQAPTSGAGNSPMGAAREAMMGRMFALYFNGLTSSSDYAGFQLAVWEIALDGDMNVATGMFQVNSASPGALVSAQLFLLGADPRRRVAGLRDRRPHRLAHRAAGPDHDPDARLGRPAGRGRACRVASSPRLNEFTPFVPGYRL